MTRMLGALITAILVLCGLASSVQTAVSVPAGAASIYTYDAPIYDAPGDDRVQGRGPPTAPSPEVSSTCPTTTYAYPATLVQVVRPKTTTGTQVRAAHGDLSSLRRSGVAAKTGSSAIDALSPAIRSNVDDAIERASTGKVRFPGHDGKVYNNSDGLLPRGGNYTEWTAAQASAKRGADRVIIEGDPANPNAIYYWDHVNPPVRVGP